MIAKIFVLLTATLISIEAAGLSAYSSGSIPSYGGHGIQALAPALSSYHAPTITAHALPAYHSSAYVTPSYASYAPAIATPAIASYHAPAVHAPAISAYHAPTLPVHAISTYTPEISSYHHAPALSSYHAAPLTGYSAPIGHYGSYGSSYGQGSFGGRYSY